MSAQFAHAPHRGSTPSTQSANHPHAALLIDFDNVTMGIRSDLSKELKNLLSSDIIKGKVAVQRAYADWRRYPQYIVPLAESSVDLIFAPAYGSSKKNATDIRLAIDALELVFTRPEIGSFILLSGDSDFSSLVLKLKEYGKYVIGVGIRESASDLLVQNCDEYYSYSALTGLTRAGDEPRGSATSQDPWELVDIAVTQMAENNDVMRSDRLKQVMLEMDPTFDEKALGFQKFNRFMQDAAARGMVSLKKLENGQFEIGPAAPGARADAEEEEQRGNGQRPRRSRRGGRGRGRDRAHADATNGADADAVADADADVEDVEPGMHADAAIEPADVITAVAPVTEAAADAIDAAPDTLSSAEIVAEESNAEVAPTSSRSRRGRGGRGRGRSASSEHAPVATGAELPPLETAARARGDTSLLKDAYALLRTATKEVLARGSATARDSDVKRRMLEQQPDWDEHPLGFSKFSRFLRQAHDAEVINLHKTDTGYDLTLGDAAVASGSRTSGRDSARETARSDRQAGLFDSAAAKSSDTAASMEAPLGSQVTHAAPMAAASGNASRGTAGSSHATSKDRAPNASPSNASSTASSAGASSVTATSAAPTAAQPGAAALGFRRGSSRGRAPAGPPPLLAGQTVPSSRSAVDEKPATSASSAPAKNASGNASAKNASGNASAKNASNAAAAAPPPASKFAALGFPTKAAEIATYLSEYKGVGPKSIQSLIDAFGAANVFDALQNKPDRVREVVSGARGETLLDAWNDDYALRKAQSTPPEKQKPAPAAATKRPGRPGPKKGPGGRGGAGGSRGGATRGGAARGASGSARGGTSRAPKRGGRKPTKRT